MKRLATTLAVLPAFASAHSDQVPHIHPHGTDLALLALAVIAGLVAWKFIRR